METFSKRVLAGSIFLFFFIPILAFAQIRLQFDGNTLMIASLLGTGVAAYIIYGRFSQ